MLVAIDGLGGAGKSTFADHLVRRLQALDVDTKTVHMDDFYLPASQQPASGAREIQIGATFDWRRLRDQVLIPLSTERRAAYQRYDWGCDRLANWITLAGPQVVVVEGVYTLRRELRSFYHVSVWVDCPRTVRLARGIARDGEEGRRQWEEEWMPQEDHYLVSHRPHLAAEWVYDGSGSGHRCTARGPRDLTASPFPAILDSS